MKSKSKKSKRARHNMDKVHTKIQNKSKISFEKFIEEKNKILKMLKSDEVEDEK